MSFEISQLNWCTNCLAMSTRPRISYDEKGLCNACRWMEKKKNLDWSTRFAELEVLLDKHRSSDGSFDCLVPLPLFEDRNRTQ